MRSAASIGGHPLHAMLITIPAGGFLLTLILDILYLATGDPGWWDATRYVLPVAVAGALVAAVPGFIDLVMVVPKGQANQIALCVCLDGWGGPWSRRGDVRAATDPSPAP